MSATNNEYKTLVDEALHNYFHDTTETEMILKDWLYGVCNKAEAFDEIEQVIYENTGLGEGDEDLVNYENLLDEIEIITNYVEAKSKAWDEFKKRQQMMVVELPRD